MWRKWSKLKSGEYIRTEEGLITKALHVYVENLIDGTTEIHIETELNPGYTDYTSEEIVKHSKNIIDLIEVGDYVNGYKVSDKESTLLVTNVKGIDKSGYHIPISQYGDGIKSIVTKEQFKNIEYKV